MELTGPSLRRAKPAENKLNKTPKHSKKIVFSLISVKKDLIMNVKNEDSNWEVL